MKQFAPCSLSSGGQFLITSRCTVEIDPATFEPQLGATVEIDPATVRRAPFPHSHGMDRLHHTCLLVPLRHQ
jgi:hypothetical protein